MFCSELWIADQGYGLLALETVPMWMWLSYFTLKFGKTQYKGKLLKSSLKEDGGSATVCNVQVLSSLKIPA
ncbi:hypothetical protein E1A91_A05G006100v1 [Gossypium mustelinum]|uniref:Uncharacterized protein n=3 Tax=Gossypium TaxID=3633 RepID=A0A5J5VI35_GOSBA|nr:hypothetical protein ES319_A05G005900v1 [Gossypium barbadense]TYI24755.1 hypothetical protein ES332_A05G006500v1 [Gossypium tomentosum]TYJ32001.1 hypothetical protein E1A91_A05G006100v1 [Gossypium mustelinum]